LGRKIHKVCIEQEAQICTGQETINELYQLYSMLLRNPKMPLPRNTLEKEGVQCKDLTDIKAWNCVMGRKRSQYTKGPSTT
jgi:hypothetical protein